MKRKDIICPHCKEPESSMLIQALEYNLKTEQHYEIHECYNDTCHKYFIVYYDAVEIKKLTEEE